MSELLVDREEKKRVMKELLLRIHDGEDIEKLKKEFKNILMRISPIEIPIIEQELVKDGVSPKEIAKLCDLHVELLRGNIEKNVDLSGITPGHPLHTLLRENEAIIKDAEMLSLYAGSLKSTKGESRKHLIDGLKDLLSQMRIIGMTHYNREEMLIFPYIERRGITAVPTVLWTKHDEIRAKISGMLRLFSKIDEMGEDKFSELFYQHSSELSSMLVDMVYRENNIFYPTVRVLLSDGEWLAVKIQEGEYGYYKVKPGNDWNPNVKPIYPYEVEGKLDAEMIIKLPPEVRKAMEEEDVSPDTYDLVREGDIELENGYLMPEEVDAIFETLPADVTFIDSEDRVKFFSKGERIFQRSKNILGRPVQLCHPPKSVHIVNEILRAFKEGRKDKAEFWIDMKGRKILIQYFPVRNKDGRYIGTLEVTQDITDIKKIEGEKRLLDWE